jgi:hypothetical protein
MKNAVLWDVALCMGLVKTDVSAESIASIFRLRRIVDQGKALAITINRIRIRRNMKYMKTERMKRDIKEMSGGWGEESVFLRSVFLLLVTPDCVLSSPSLVPL